MQLLWGGEGRLSLGDLLRLQSYLPLIFFSPFRTTVPPWINRHATFAIAGDFNNTVYLLILTFDINDIKNSFKEASILRPQERFLLNVLSYSQIFQYFFPPPKSFPHKSYFTFATNARLKLLMKIYCILIFSVEWFTHSLCFTAVGKR